MLSMIGLSGRRYREEEKCNYGERGFFLEERMISWYSASWTFSGRQYLNETVDPLAQTAACNQSKPLLYYMYRDLTERESSTLSTY
jgi:hypothetical protein